MLYSIVLPSIIILSLALVIVFLAKKASVVKKIEEEGQFEEKMKNKDKDSFWKKLCFFCEKSLFPNFKKGLLFMMNNIKLGFLKIYKSLFSKDAKERRGEKDGFSKKNLLKKFKRNKTEKSRNQRVVLDDEDEKNVRPMISDKVTNPKSKTEMKDRFEEILIERVATNPKDIEAYERLGEYYFEIGNMKDAKECFKQVIKLDATNQRAKFKIEKIDSDLAK